VYLGHQYQVLLMCGKCVANVFSNVYLEHQEQEQSQQEEAEYEDALKTALGKSSKGAPPLPLDPLPTH